MLFPLLSAHFILSAWGTLTYPLELSSVLPQYSVQAELVAPSSVCQLFLHSSIITSLTLLDAFFITSLSSMLEHELFEGRHSVFFLHFMCQSMWPSH